MLQTFLTLEELILLYFKNCVPLCSPTLPINAHGTHFLTINYSFQLLNFTFQAYKNAAGKRKDL